jgi:hypothetical protein
MVSALLEFLADLFIDFLAALPWRSKRDDAPSSDADNHSSSAADGNGEQPRSPEQDS